MSTLKDHERRITTLEGRVGEIETSHGGSLSTLHRFRVRTDLQLGRIMSHFGIEPITEEEVDEVLDAE